MSLEDLTGYIHGVDYRIDLEDSENGIEQKIYNRIEQLLKDKGELQTKKLPLPDKLFLRTVGRMIGVKGVESDARLTYETEVTLPDRNGHELMVTVALVTDYRPYPDPKHPLINSTDKLEIIVIPEGKDPKTQRSLIFTFPKEGGAWAHFAANFVVGPNFSKDLEVEDYRMIELLLDAVEAIPQVF